MTRLAATIRRIARLLLAPRQPTGVPPDSCEPGCTAHAYCEALEHALHGQHALIIIGHHPEGGRTMFAICARLSGDTARYASHPDQRVRAAFSANAMHVAHGALADAGKLR